MTSNDISNCNSGSPSGEEQMSPVSFDCSKLQPGLESGTTAETELTDFGHESVNDPSRSFESDFSDSDPDDSELEKIEADMRNDYNNQIDGRKKTFHMLAGVYLIYTAYNLLSNVIKDPSVILRDRILFSVFGVVFLVSGMWLVISFIRFKLKQNKDK